MTQKDLHRAMSEISDEYILEAAPDEACLKKAPFWTRPAFKGMSGVIAASLILLIGIGTYQRTHMRGKDENAVQNDQITQSAPDGAMGQPGGSRPDAAVGAADEDAADTGVVMEAEPQMNYAYEMEGARPENAFVTEMDAEDELATERMTEEESESEQED